jgi:DNA-directed RNA polymerase subunit K/omega
MNDPLTVALREIADTRRLLDTLITSSESFDYPKAKIALRELNRKVRDLAKIERSLQAKWPPCDPKIHVLDFSKSGACAQL